MSLLGVHGVFRSCLKNSYAVWINIRPISNQTAAENEQKTTKENEQKTQENSDKYEEDIRNKILTASLPYVNELGWSREALSSGAKDVGYPGVTHGLFLRGGADLVHFFQTSSNQKLVEFMKTETEMGSPKIPGEFVEKAVKYRLEMTVPYISRWPQAIAIMTLPPNVPKALATVLTMVDDICYFAGDRSVDFNWYARRVALAGVYKATELYLIQDKSIDHQNSWIFLNNRLKEAIKIQDLITQGDLTPSMAKDGITSAFTTARNILGLNWNR